jgi:hypothetical protein
MQVYSSGDAHHDTETRQAVPPTALATCLSATDRAKVARPAVAALRIRRITQSDTESYRSLLMCASLEDIYCRFFHIVNSLELRDVAQFVEPRPDVIGFIAEKRSKVVGAAHAFMSPNGDEAEIAVFVAIDARRSDIGHALLERLIDELHAHECCVVSAYSLVGNNAFSHLARSVGMKPIGAPSDVTTWSLSDDAA